eukprot:15458371-Alexandrium_andersonii.AAC.1
MAGRSSSCWEQRHPVGPRAPPRARPAVPLARNTLGRGRGSCLEGQIADCWFGWLDLTGRSAQGR